MRFFSATTMSTSSSRALRVLVFSCASVTVLVLAAVLGATAGATPLADKQAQAAALDREVGDLEHRHSELGEKYRGALVELKDIEKDVELTKTQLAASRAKLDVARERLRVRALGIYRDGAGSSQVLEVTKAGSIDDFFTKLEAIEQVSEHDSQLLDEVRDLTERVEKKEKRLATAQAKQKKVVKRAASAQKKMAKVLADRQAALAAANADVRAMMYEQRAAAARADATAARGRAAAIGRGDAPSEGASDGGSAGSSSGGSSGGGDTSIPLPPASGVAARAASIAMGKIGAPYVYGASGPNTFDCSGLISWAFAQAGRGGLPHSTYALMGMGVSVPLSQAQVGDIVITDGGGHGGIYVGGGSIVHAPRSGRTVTVESLGYYSVVTVRRI